MKRVTARADLDAELARYRAFEECLLRKFAMTDFGLAFEAELEYIWDDQAPGDAQLVADVSRRVTMRFIRPVRVEARFSPPPVAPGGFDAGSWGLVELALVEAHEKVRVGNLGVSFVWEHDQRITIEFEAVEIASKP
ncbi:hypothetical protein AB0L40_04930 [Patulibacter sp. NPDC049589]|uniref:hypothetical protein n=1 Tax=Patulibacter sp. NPDC049589 TaxID=3154731 RepID=UPI00342FFA5E